MARKKKHEEHENHERWLVSYADFITLLFAFFVVLYSISSVNEGKYRVLSESLNAAFRTSARSMDPIQVGQLARSPRNQAQSMDVPAPMRYTPIIIMPPTLPEETDKHPSYSMDENEWALDEASAQVNYIADDVEDAFEEMISEGVINVYRDRLMLQLEINSQILFTSASATPSQEAEIILRKIAELLRDYPNIIHVEGFADNVPIKSPVFPSNWELSSARAAAVVRLFAEFGVEPERMASVGYAEFKPVASNDTEEGRAKNRRVVVVVLANTSNEADDSDFSEITLLRQNLLEAESSF